MKRLLQSFLFITIALLVADRLGGKVMWWINQHTQDIYGPKLKYLADDVSEDIVLLGTSRCNYHYVPSILTDTIGMSAYNGGIDASDCIFAHYYALNLILNHHKPKIICLELWINDYASSDNPFETTSFFAPYIGRSERADSVYRLAGNYWQYHLCHLYRYNSRGISNIRGLFVNEQEGNDNGYTPLPMPATYPDKPDTIHTSTSIDTVKLEYIEKFIYHCRDNNIKLIFMVSPAYMTADANLYDILKDIAKKHQVPFLDYHTANLFMDHPEYFKDTGHLWDKGARIYTSIFAHDLKKILSQ